MSVVWSCIRDPRQPAVLNMSHVHTVAYSAPHGRRPHLSSEPVHLALNPVFSSVSISVYGSKLLGLGQV